MEAKTDSPQPPTNILRRTEFDRQLTQSVMERVLKQSIQLIAEVERKTPWRDQVGPDDRLHTAILKRHSKDRGAGIQDRVDLGGQLFGIVSSDIDKELRRSVKAPHLSLEDNEHQNLEALRLRDGTRARAQRSALRRGADGACVDAGDDRVARGRERRTRRAADPRPSTTRAYSVSAR